MKVYIYNKMRKLFTSFIVVTISVMCLVQDGYCSSLFNWSFSDTKNERKITDDEGIEIEQGGIIDAVDIFKKKIENIIYMNFDRPDLETVNNSVINYVTRFESRINTTNLKKSDFTIYSQDLCMDILNSFDNPNDKLKINIINEINMLYSNVTNETIEICDREHFFDKKSQWYTENKYEILLFAAVPVFFAIRLYIAYKCCLSDNLNNNFDNNMERDDTSSIIQAIFFTTI